MKNISNYIYILLSALSITLFSSCREIDSFENDGYGNFDALWTILDQHYCFFGEKDIDWNEVKERYRSQLKPEMTQFEYFNLLSQMLAELKDGHVNLSSSFNVSYYRNWWSDYPQDFNLRTLEQYYLGFDYNVVAGVFYKILNNKVGYIYCPSFSSQIGESNLDYILFYFEGCEYLIIDVRNNGGGLLSNVPAYVSRFITNPVSGGYIRHKTGPGHDDFSEPYPIEYKPCDSKRISWTRPVLVLTNRSTFSAANDFVSVMKSLPNVHIIGARTGGGGGLPFMAELPIGWKIRFSASPISNEKDESTEFGIDPSPGCEVHASDEELAQGKDAILDFALSFFKK